MTTLGKLAAELRKSAGAFVSESLFKGMSAAGRLHPLARPERHNVEVLRDIPYAAVDREHHRLDVYRPSVGKGPWPVVLYVHGGAFRILSKETHWIMGLAYARRGFVVFNINYRLAPTHPFPAAIEDTCHAFRWVVEHAKDYGGDASKMILAGESAGANLVTALALATSYARPEPFAKAAFDTGVSPRAVVAACGMLEVSNPERFLRKKKLSSFVYDRIVETSHGYIGDADGGAAGGLDLANPLLVFERGDRPARRLPPFFAPVGTADPLLDDTRRLRAAIDRLGGRCVDRYYEGELHAFHAVVFRPRAKKCWEETFSFVDEALQNNV